MPGLANDLFAPRIVARAAGVVSVVRRTGQWRVRLAPDLAAPERLVGDQQRLVTA